MFTPPPPRPPDLICQAAEIEKGQGGGKIKKLVDVLTSLLVRPRSVSS